MWSLAQQDKATGRKARIPNENQTQSVSGDTLHITKLDDLQTSMLLYSYGLPIAAALEGVIPILID
jgi:hypothetical protein